MNEVADTLWMVWLLYWASAAFVGAFFGTLAALAARALFRKVLQWSKGDQRHGSTTRQR